MEKNFSFSASTDSNINTLLNNYSKSNLTLTNTCTEY